MFTLLNDKTESKCLQDQDKTESKCLQDQDKTESKCLQDQDKTESKCLQDQDKTESKCLQDQDKTESKCLQDQDKTESKCLQDQDKTESKSLQDQDKTESKCLQDQDKTESKCLQDQDKSKCLQDQDKTEFKCLRDQDKTESKSLRDQDKTESKCLQDQDKTEPKCPQDQDKTESKCLQDQDKTESKCPQDQDKTESKCLQDQDKTGSKCPQDQNKTESKCPQDQDKTKCLQDQDKTESSPSAYKTKTRVQSKTKTRPSPSAYKTKTRPSPSATRPRQDRVQVPTRPRQDRVQVPQDQDKTKCLQDQDKTSPSAYKTKTRPSPSAYKTKTRPSPSAYKTKTRPSPSAYKTKTRPSPSAYKTKTRPSPSAYKTKTRPSPSAYKTKTSPSAYKSKTRSNPNQDKTESKCLQDQDKSKCQQDQDKTESKCLQDQDKSKCLQDQDKTESECLQDQDKTESKCSQDQDESKCLQDQDKTESKCSQDQDESKCPQNQDKTESKCPQDQDKTESKCLQDQNKTESKCLQDQDKTESKCLQDQNKTESKCLQDQDKTESKCLQDQDKTESKCPQDQDKTESKCLQDQDKTESKCPQDQDKTESKCLQDQDKTESKCLQDQDKTESKCLQDQDKTESKCLQDQDKTESKCPQDQVKIESKCLQDQDKTESKCLQDQDKSKCLQDQDKTESKCLQDQDKTESKCLQDQDKSKCLQDQDMTESKCPQDQVKIESKCLQDQDKTESKCLQDQDKSKCLQDQDKTESKCLQDQDKTESKCLQDQDKTESKCLQDQDKTESKCPQDQDKSKCLRDQDNTESKCSQDQDESKCHKTKTRPSPSAHKTRPSPSAYKTKTRSSPSAYKTKTRPSLSAKSKKNERKQDFILFESINNVLLVKLAGASDHMDSLRLESDEDVVVVDEFACPGMLRGSLTSLHTNIQRIFRVHFTIGTEQPHQDDHGQIWLKLRGASSDVQAAKLFVKGVVNQEEQQEVPYPANLHCVFCGARGLFMDGLIRTTSAQVVIVSPGCLLISGLMEPAVRAYSLITDLVQRSDATQSKRTEPGERGLGESLESRRAFKNLVEQWDDRHTVDLLVLPGSVKEILLDLIKEAKLGDNPRPLQTDGAKREDLSSSFPKDYSASYFDSFGERGGRSASMEESSKSPQEVGEEVEMLAKSDGHETEQCAQLSGSKEFWLLLQFFTAMGYTEDVVQRVLAKTGIQEASQILDLVQQEQDRTDKELRDANGLTQSGARTEDVKNKPCETEHREEEAKRQTNLSPKRDIDELNDAIGGVPEPQNDNFVLNVLKKAAASCGYNENRVTKLPDKSMHQFMLELQRNESKPSGYLKEGPREMDDVVMEVSKAAEETIKRENGHEKMGAKQQLVKDDGTWDGSQTQQTKRHKQESNKPRQQHYINLADNIRGPPSTSTYETVNSSHYVNNQIFNPTKYSAARPPTSQVKRTDEMTNGSDWGRDRRGQKEAVVVTGEQRFLEGLHSQFELRLTASPGNSRLRHIVIDGSNVAMSHGLGHFFSCRGIAIAVQHFWDRGHRQISALVPQWRTKSDPRIKEQRYLGELQDLGMVSFTPSREVQGKRITAYDDRLMLQLAQKTNGVIVTNDNLRDLSEECSEWTDIIKKRLLQYTFVGDVFMVPDDPLGRNGPHLDQFLELSSPDSTHTFGVPIDANRKIFCTSVARTDRRWRSPQGQNWTKPAAGPRQETDRSPEETARLREQLSLVFPGQDSMVTLVLQSHPKETDINTLSSLLLEESPD
ncbi:hypothetical protein WMY93_015174 [Mugilogobius chulae]|uniref:RNase NYN domain-containing protein n=1 Tax=Mugilogobius chulae TaxID=88201 RepID=A0AAW0P8R9_9GOBI